MEAGMKQRLGIRSRRVCQNCIALALGCLLAAAWPSPGEAYAVLAHEAIIDIAWRDIRPLLRKRFPDATGEELRVAHGYVYGGAIIQDMGYYPHGSHLFSDLTHYVRSGDFILAMIRDSRDLNEYAFALGALSHYAADCDGHRIGVNPSVPLLYPKLEEKYGSSVTYEQDPLAHIKTEFGFDVGQVAKNHYAPDAYHDFIGFGVAKRVLEQAFEETYGLPLRKVLPDEDKALGSYRRAVSKQIPKATRIAWSLKQDEIKADVPGITKRRFLYNLSRASYEREWGKDYQKPSFLERFLAFLWKLVPRFGPLKVLEFRTPTPHAEQMFEASFNAVIARYDKLLGDADSGSLNLSNENFDTGGETPPGTYFMNDDAHAALLNLLAEQHFSGASPELRAAMLEFYSHPDADYSTKKKPREWAKVQAELEQWKAAAVADPGQGLALPAERPEANPN